MDQTEKSRRNLPSVDRLSALPEGIICHILSFLPTKTSLLTSILARRWRYLWANVPNLDFDSTSHHSETSFTSIITRVMCLHKVQRINTFRLCYKDGCSLYEFETLIVVVISRDVHVLDICLDYQVILPRCLFTCKTLVDLRLECCVINSFGAAVFLPCLKKLRLFYVKYDVGENLAKLFTGCPVLEELFMARLEEDGLVGCKIFSPTIKFIVLDFAYNPLVHDNHEHKVDLNAPALSYLQLKGFSSTHISSQMLTSLTQVDVSFGDDPCAYEENCFLSVLFFIFSLSNMKCLKLAFPYELELDGSLIADDLPETKKKLAKLKKLEFEADLLFLPNLLACADNLEVLIIREDVLGWWWEKPEKVPTCLLSHLRSVRIDGIGYRCHFKMVKYILRNARVLKRMKIYCQKEHEFDFKAKFEALQRISLFPRASKACELAFY